MSKHIFGFQAQIMKNRPYYDATLAACNRFLSNFNFLFINVFLGSIYLFIAYVSIVIRFLTGQFVNQLLL